MTKNTSEIVQGISSIDAQIRNREGILKELGRDRAGSTSTEAFNVIDGRVKDVTGQIAEMKRDKAGMMSQLSSPRKKKAKKSKAKRKTKDCGCK